MTTINYNIRIDQNLKDRAFSVFESYGLSPSQAIKLFLSQVAETQSVPISLNYNSIKEPNEITLQAMQEAIENRQNQKLSKGYLNLDEMMKDIQEWKE